MPNHGSVYIKVNNPLCFLRTFLKHNMYIENSLELDRNASLLRIVFVNFLDVIVWWWVHLKRCMYILILGISCDDCTIQKGLWYRRNCVVRSHSKVSIDFVKTLILKPCLKNETILVNNVYLCSVILQVKFLCETQFWYNHEISLPSSYILCISVVPKRHKGR